MLSNSAVRGSLGALALAALLLWAPLPAGSVQPGYRLLFRLLAVVLFVLVLLGHRGRRAALGHPAVLALGGVALLGLMQSCGWPAAVAARLSPRHVELRREAAMVIAAANPVSEDPLAGDSSPPPSRVPLSLDASVSRSSALSWLASAALLAAALVSGRSQRHRRWLLMALVLAATTQVGLGLWRLQVASPGGLAAVALLPEGRLQGSYANPNHLSLLLEIGLVTVAAWAWLEVSRLRRHGPRGRVRPLVPILLWLLFLAGVVLTGSRSGLLAALFGTVVQLAVLPSAGRGRRFSLVAGLVLGLGLGAFALLGGGQAIERYARVSLYESNLRGRLLLAGPSLELWRDFPLTGTGLGTFEDAFPLVSPSEFNELLWNRAHNDPLELLVTGGVLALGLGLLALVSLLRPIWRGLRQGPRLEDRAVSLAAMGAIGAVGLHELFDFGLVIPANSLTLLVVLGAAAAVGAAVPRNA